jgi:hypothetical protein
VSSRTACGSIFSGVSADARHGPITVCFDDTAPAAGLGLSADLGVQLRGGGVGAQDLNVLGRRAAGSPEPVQSGCGIGGSGAWPCRPRESRGGPRRGGVGEQVPEPMGAWESTERRRR